ncbi:MAG TPA: SlyX family protein [Azoarcus sp.]|nr:SlyX family protein [Azoarcus sp.]
MEERLEKLEIRFMATEDLLDELNRTVWRQQNEIELLREHVRLLADQLRTVQASASDMRQEDEIPPHW